MAGGREEPNIVGHAPNGKDVVVVVVIGSVHVRSLSFLMLIIKISQPLSLSSPAGKLMSSRILQRRRHLARLHQRPIGAPHKSFFLFFFFFLFKRDSLCCRNTTEYKRDDAGLVINAPATVHNVFIRGGFPAAAL